MKQKIKNKLLNKLLSEKQLQKVKNPEVTFPGGIVPIAETQDQDVFVVGFPKSGNTLMQHIIAHLVYGFNDMGSRSLVNLIVPDIHANSHYFRFNEVCFFKSHRLPNPHYKKVIYIMRDGREALLSYFHMMKNMESPVSMEDLYTGKELVLNTTWGEHITQWEANPFKADILWIKYEDLKTDKYKELTRICEFLDLERTKQELNQVVELTSLDAMKKLESRADWSRMKDNVSFNKGSFVREGKINSYLEQVPTEIIQKFEVLNAKALNEHYLK